MKTTPPSESYPIEEKPAEGEIVPGEIPDWLQTMAPQGTGAEPEPKKDEFSDWLSKLDQSPDTLQQTGILSDEKLEASEHAAAPEWINQTPEASPTPTAVPTPDTGSNLPDWLSDIGKNLSGTAALQPSALDGVSKEVKPPEKPVTPQPKATGSLKFATDENFPVFGGTSILSPDDVPDWLQDLEPSSQPSTTNKSDIFSSTSSLAPSEPAHTDVPQETITSKLTPDEKDEIPEWLKDIQGSAQSEPETTAPPAILETPQEVSTMKLTPEEKMVMPEWLTEIQSETIPEQTPAEEPVVDERKTATLPEEERDEVEQMPEWLHLLEQEGPEIASEPVAEMKSAKDVEPSVSVPFDFTSFAQPAETEAAPADEMPDFLKEARFLHFCFHRKSKRLKNQSHQSMLLLFSLLKLSLNLSRN